VHRADNLTTFMQLVLKSGSLTLLEPSGSVQACNGIAFYNSEIYNYVCCMWNYIHLMKTYSMNNTDVLHSAQQYVKKICYPSCRLSRPFVTNHATQDDTGL